MKMTENGVSTTLVNGQEQYTMFRVAGRQRVQYDFRDENGELFSCIGKDLQHCRQKRDEWEKKKNEASQGMRM